jgi:proteic killer suppression protein
MNVRFEDGDLDRLETDPRFTNRLPPEVVRAFRKLMQYIRAATDERDFYEKKSLRFEQLQGDKEGQRSMRLNDQWRLVVELEGESPTKTVVVVKIDDYH